MKQTANLSKGKFLKGLFGVDEAYAGVLTALGLPADQFEALKGVTAETLKDFKPETFVNHIKTGLENTFLNDPNFLSKITKEKVPEAVRKDIESGQYGRFMNEFKDYATKTLGLDLADLTADEEKSLKKVAEKVTSKYAGKLGSPEALKTLQSELSKAVGEKTDLERSFNEKLQTTVANEQVKTSNLLTTLLTQIELGKIEGGIKVDPSLVVAGVLDKAKAAYTLKTEGTEVIVKRKDNPELDAMKADGSKKTFSDVITEIATEMKLPNEKKAVDPKEGEGVITTVEVNGNKGVKLPANIAAKVNENIKAEKSAS